MLNTEVERIRSASEFENETDLQLCSEKNL